MKGLIVALAVVLTKPLRHLQVVLQCIWCAFGSCGEMLLSPGSGVSHCCETLSHTDVCHPQAVMALRAAMEDFFDKKASRLSRKVLEDGLRAAPAAGAALLHLPLGRAASASTAYRRTEALAVLAALLRPAKVPSQPPPQSRTKGPA